MTRWVGEAGSAFSRVIRLGAVLAGVAALTAAGCAAAAPYNPSHLAEPDRASVAGLCQGVMGLTRNNARFDACMEGLSDSVLSAARARDLQRAQTDCMALGLFPGRAALAECELREKDAPVARLRLVDDPDAGTPMLHVIPYWRASNAEIHRREEMSCARVGLEPVGASFAACVGQLDAALFAADNSAH